MPPSSTVHGGQHDTKYVTFELLWHAAFVANVFFYFLLEPAGRSYRLISVLEDRWQRKRDVAKKKTNFKDTRHKISVQLAMSANLRKKVSELTKKNEENNSCPGQILGQDWPEKNRANIFNSRRRDSESSTDIDQQNQRLRHEFWTRCAR